MIKNNIRNYIFTAISERKKEKGKKKSIHYNKTSILGGDGIWENKPLIYFSNTTRQRIP